MPHGIPHSVFLSWDDDDQAKALAWERERSKVCSICGSRLEEWDESCGGDRHAYVSESVRCPGCELLDIHREHLDPEESKGVRITLVPRGMAE